MSVTEYLKNRIGLAGTCRTAVIAINQYRDNAIGHGHQSTGFHRDFFLFGEHLVERGDTGYLVEGHFDAMYLRQMGYGNAVATMGSHLSGIQVEKCVIMFNEVVIFPDGDQAGGEAALRWEHALKGRVPVAVADCVPEMDPDNYDEDQLEDLLSVDNLSFD